MTVNPADTLGGTAQLHDGRDMLGTVDQLDEDGERSWAVAVIVLAEDLEGWSGSALLPARMPTVACDTTARLTSEYTRGVIRRQRHMDRDTSSM